AGLRLAAQDAVVVGGAGQGGEDLLAVDAPAAVHAPGRGGERRRAGGCRPALREGLGVDGAVLDDAGVVDGAAAPVLGAIRLTHVEVVGERPGPQARADVHVVGERRGAAVAPDLGGRRHVGAVAGAEASLLLGDAQAEQAGIAHVAV